MHIVNVMYVVLRWVCKIKTKFSEAKLRAGQIEWFARTARYLNFCALWKPNNDYGGKRMFLTCGKTSNFNNKPTSRNTYPCAIHTQWRKHYVHWEIILVSNDLDKWPFWSLTLLASLMHHSASLYKERSISDEEILKYSFRTEVKPGSHRSADLWLFWIKEQYAASFCRARFKYGVRSLNT